VKRRVRGWTALVTGGSSGIGAAVAEVLVRQGCQVVLSGRDRERLDDVAQRVGARAYAHDLADPAAPAALAADAGDVDLLVANAGFGWAGPFAAMAPDDLDRLVRVDFLAVLQLVRAVLPGMLARRRGHIVLVSSIAGCMAVPGESAYSAVKAGLRGLGASLRAELAGEPVGISVVFPGVVDTPFFTHRGAPYDRERPRPIPAATVAGAILDAVQRDRAEVFAPRWLRFPARLRGAVPSLTDAIQRRVD
jgi:short-subunit dehydrogenase